MRLRTKSSLFGVSLPSLVWSGGSLSNSLSFDMLSDDSSGCGPPQRLQPTRVLATELSRRARWLAALGVLLCMNVDNRSLGGGRLFGVGVGLDVLINPEQLRFGRWSHGTKAENTSSISQVGWMFF